MRFPFTIHPETEEEKFMLQALKLAWQALEEEEVPVGAVVVCSGELISKGYNQVEKLQDATAHAEMLAITAASEFSQAWRLNDCTLYTTLEPCCMCMGAAFLSRIKKIVYAAPDLRIGACGSWINLIGQKHPLHTIEVVGGIYASFASDLMTQFFRKKRLEKKETT